MAMRTTFSASDSSPPSPSGASRQGDGVIRVERAFLGQRVQRRESPSAGHYGKALVALVVGAVGAGNEILQKAVGADGSRELVLGGLVRRRLAHVLGRKREIRKGDLAEGGIGRGCSAVHAILRG